MFMFKRLQIIHYIHFTRITYYNDIEHVCSSMTYLKSFVNIIISSSTGIECARPYWKVVNGMFNIQSDSTGSD